jgi:hypothetical protein
MSSSHTYLTALAITGSILAGSSVLVGSTQASPGRNQETVLQTATPLSPTFISYLLASSGDHDRQGDHDRAQERESAQENNSGTEESQPPMVPTTWARPIYNTEMEEMI